MHSITKRVSLLIFLSFNIVFFSKAQSSLSVPVMAGNTNPNVQLEICEKGDIQLRFEHFNFLDNNIFTVEMAANGDFVNGPIIPLVGQRGPVGGNSTNQNISVSFPVPNNIQPNTNYQVRIKGSSPLTFSSPNPIPFRVAKIGALADTAFFPEGYWRGSFFKWTPNTPNIIVNANTQDMFNPNNYLGYVTKEALSFDLNWGFDITAAPGNLFDTSKVCGNQVNFYSIRMRRRVNFEAGYYIFGGGGDDGFRLSTDGGATWLINLWRDQELTGRLNNNGCGVFLEAGPRNLVVDYYERAEHSRFQVIIRRTGDPLANPFTITNPAAGSTVCIQTPPFQMTTTAPGAETWSGPGVSPTGIFNPQAAGLGFKTISYETGMAGFGSNCVRTTSVTIRVVEGLTSDFAGLDSNYCEGRDTINLVPAIAGGVFFGEGVVGNQLFTESMAPGRRRIGYALDPITNCGGDTVWKTFVIRPKPNATFQTLPDSVLNTSPPIQLVPVQVGGIFSGNGVVPVNSQWIPSLLQPGVYTISYNITVDGCSNSSDQTVRVVGCLASDFAGLDTSYCEGINTINLVPQTPGGVFVGQGIVGNQLFTENLPLGRQRIGYAPNPSTSCGVDTVWKTFVIRPKPNATFQPLPDSVFTTSPAIQLIPVQAGGTFSGDAVVTTNSQWIPSILQPGNYRISYNITANGCSSSSEQIVRVVLYVKPIYVIPNVISPNGDAANEVFYVKGFPDGISVSIFNRWGKEIYTGKTENELVWKGPEGNETGTYFYKLVNEKDGEKFTGWLTVVR